MTSRIQVALLGAVLLGGACGVAPVIEGTATGELSTDAGRADAGTEADSCGPNTGGPYGIGEISVDARRVVFSEPVVVEDATGDRVEADEIVELELTTSNAVYIGGLFPALRLGDHLVTNFRYVSACRLVFSEPDPASLPDGEEVLYQWGDGDRTDRLPSGFVYRAAELPVEQR